MKLPFSLAAVIVGLALAGTARASITIDTVPVGNLGNAADTTGYGSVDYAYNIGKYEVTASQYAAFLNAVAATDTYELYNTGMSGTVLGSGIARAGSSGSYTYSVNPAFINRPVNYVNFGDSMRFSNWLHNGQPTGAQDAGTTEDGAYYVNGATYNSELLAAIREVDWQWAVTSADEWYKAGYYNPNGNNYYLYATSSNSAPGHDMVDLSGNNANYYTGSGPYPIDSGMYTTAVGEFQNSDSPYSTFDQSGNMWEWTEAIMAGSHRGLRGGAFNSYESHLQSGYINYDSPLTEYLYIGFRVVQVSVPEPASLSLLTLGGAAMFVRRRRGTRR